MPLENLAYLPVVSAVSVDSRGKGDTVAISQKIIKVPAVAEAEAPAEAEMGRY